MNVRLIPILGTVSCAKAKSGTYQVKNLNKKRVCDISIDNTTAYIRKGDCVTEIHATNGGTLCVSHKLDSNVS